MEINIKFIFRSAIVALICLILFLSSANIKNSLLPSEKQIEKCVSISNYDYKTCKHVMME